MLVKVPSKDTATGVAALTRQVRKLPASLRRSLTWDRGVEMAKHKSFTVATKVNVYFCDPQRPWQRFRAQHCYSSLPIRLVWLKIRTHGTALSPIPTVEQTVTGLLR